MTLTQAIEKYAGGQKKALLRHLYDSGIQNWRDMTTVRLTDLVEELANTVAPGSARTYLATLRHIITLMADTEQIPCKCWRDVLKARGERSTATFLTPDELTQLERVKTMTPNEHYVLNEFLVATRTGCRHSDLMALTPENVENGMLTYTSIKTGITASVPCSERTAEMIKAVREHPELPLMTYNRIIRRLCERAGICEVVKRHRAGTDEVGPKWKFISSHSARRSVATNLSIAGTPTHDIMFIMGHTSEQMTSRYICQHEIALNDNARKLFD